jgi:hypothetical protein
MRLSRKSSIPVERSRAISIAGVSPCYVKAWCLGCDEAWAAFGREAQTEGAGAIGELALEHANETGHIVRARFGPPGTSRKRCS